MERLQRSHTLAMFPAKRKLAGKRAQNNNNKNMYHNFPDITNRFSQIICEKTTKLPSRQKSCVQQDGAEKEKGDACARVVT